MVVLEALMQTSLTQAFDTGGILEIIEGGKNGLLVKSNDNDSLMRKLIYVYENKGKQTIDKDELKNRFQSNFILETQIERIVECLVFGV